MIVVYRQRRVQTSSQPVAETVTPTPRQLPQPHQRTFTVMSPVFDYQTGYDELIDLNRNENYDHPDVVEVQPVVPGVYQRLDEISVTNA